MSQFCQSSKRKHDKVLVMFRIVKKATDGKNDILRFNGRISWNIGTGVVRVEQPTKDPKIFQIHQFAFRQKRNPDTESVKDTQTTFYRILGGFVAHNSRLEQWKEVCHIFYGIFDALIQSKTMGPFIEHQLRLEQS
jgi:hypothetical protein